MYRRHKDDVTFLMVYIKEAHASDGRVSQANVRQGINIRNHTDYADRADVAKTACSLLKIELPAIVDGMNDAVSKAYAAAPDRIYVVDKDGRIAVMADRGPRGFNPGVEAARRWLEARAKEATPK
jgi:hypothetical protein